MPEIKATHIKRDNTKFSSTAEFYSGLNGVCFKPACPVDFLRPYYDHNLACIDIVPVTSTHNVRTSYQWDFFFKKIK